MNENIPAGVFAIIIGLLCIAGAWLRWAIVMNPAKLLPRILGEKTARIVYIVIGLVLIGIGIGLITGWTGG
jgi:small neutral amino acid transporter SnatA (MarC family)